MTVKELIELINNATYLTNEMKEKWIGLIPKMSEEQLKELAKIISWGEDQKKKLYKEKDTVISGVQEIFTSINNYSTKKAKKELPKILEYDIQQKEKVELDNLLKELENE